MCRFLLMGVLVCLLFCRSLTLAAQPRITENFDAGWRFFPGDDGNAKDPGYDDSKWRKLDLPHDWSIEGNFSEQNNTGQQEGGLPAGIGWYRKTFRTAG